MFIDYRVFLEDLGEGPRGSPGGCLEIGRVGGDPRFTAVAAAAAAKLEAENEDHRGGGSDGESVSLSLGGSGTSLAESQLRVFGKPTGLSRVSAVTDAGVSAGIGALAGECFLVFLSYEAR